ncbi:hypothetical protein N7495_003798 [Penicillium taxi]|uniref:uncharacterized protein n=1 Tax=Penicillium taxi TaxID=168475 RepID=UPI0025450B29|nr:uncharacterized protein N7495_003798 [Penicillium taxi]KAJ5899054.1 hypothetical protein N7495_003798 [Penicillium taxi]
MAESSNSAASGGTGGSAKPKAVPKPQNPVFRMMGLPHINFKLPSRNWMIFWTITGSFTGAIMYDRREKRLAQQKWCDLVAHITEEPLPVEQMRRKLTIYLAAPPGDSLRVARDHFKEYIKPILTAASLDYTIVEGRREGDVRASTAEMIRKLRRKAGEPSSVAEEPSVESAVLETRERIGIQDEPGPKGDMVIGRHAWKEYIRGLHEGWLGPLDPPVEVSLPEVVPAPVEASTPESIDEAMKDIATGDKPSETPVSSEDEKKTDEKEKEKEKPTGPPNAYIYPAEYPSASLPPTLPVSFDNSVPVEFPHILGFLNTPIRIYRFLNQRYVADSIGREVAGLVLAANERSYRDESFSLDSELSGASIDSTPSPNDLANELSRGKYEQQTVLENEEKEWHKSVHKADDTGRERVLVDDMVLDPRIASRMKLALLSPEDEARSQRIAKHEEYILGKERPASVPFWKQLWIKYGNGEDEETIRRKPIYGNIDGEDGV